MTRFGIATLNHSPLHGSPTQLVSHLDAAGEAGFDALAPDVFWLRRLEEEGVGVSRLRRELDARGLGCMEIAGIAIGASEATALELEEHVRWSEALGAEFVNARVVEPIDDALLERARGCAEALARVGTRLALEFSRGTQLRSVTEARAFAESIGVPGVGVTLDTWHFCLRPEGVEWDALEALPAEWLANVQLSDGVPYGEDEFGTATMDRRKFPGEGGFDLDRVVETLAARGLDVPVVLEVLTAETRNGLPGLHTRRAFESASRVWKARRPS